MDNCSPVLGKKYPHVTEDSDDDESLSSSDNVQLAVVSDTVTFSEIDLLKNSESNSDADDITNQGDRSIQNDIHRQRKKCSNNENDTAVQFAIEAPIECNKNSDTNFAQNEIPSTEKANDITFDQTGEILKQILKPGVGNTNPGYGDKVYILYTGYLHIGDSLKPFDTSEDKVYFHLGRGAVIRGLDYGITTMKKSEVALFIIQPEYAYGSIGNPPTIPPNAVIFFEVELLEWKLEDLSPQKDEGILRKVIQRGEGLNFPNDGTHIEAHIIGIFNNHIFEDRDVNFILGEGYNFGIAEGVEIALLKFKLQEKSTLFLKAQYAMDLRKEITDFLTDEAVLEYEVTLHFFEKVKDVWEMNSDEKYEHSVKAKAKGISYIQDSSYKVALKQFKKIITYLENEPGISPDSEEARNFLLISSYLNASLCHMKMENFFDAIKMCNKVLEKDSQNEKALYRRGQSCLSVNYCEDAIRDFQKVLEIYPNNAASKNALILCKSKIDEQAREDRSIYSNMFQKFVNQDEEERKRRALRTETGIWEKKIENPSENDDCNDVLKMLISLDSEN